ncbi:hypothetical protein [Arthrobacter sp.]|uniref:hypothetical protein n=1 Tax=Arthrobacter sp. TaxID=1667 RepID=UPI003A8E0A1F
MLGMSGSELSATAIAIVVVIALFAALTWVFTSRPGSQPNDADRYIARLNDAAARQQQLDTEKAEKIRAATTARAARAASTSPGRTGQSTGVGHPAPAGTTATAGNPDYERVLQLVRSGNPIAAIKKVRQDTGISLIEAKQYVDSLRGK